MSDPYDLSGPAGKPAQPAAEPKIIIDSDWKQQAAAEKEKLAAEERRREAEAAEAGPGAGRMPPADFMGLLGSLATQALLYLGGIADPETGRAIVSLEYAKHYIDMLTVLEEKTKGNLTDEESRELAGVLQELRQRFVYIARQMATQGGAGAAPGAPGAPGMPGGAGIAGATGFGPTA